MHLILLGSFIAMHLGELLVNMISMLIIISTLSSNSCLFVIHLQAGNAILPKNCKENVHLYQNFCHIPAQTYTDGSQEMTLDNAITQTQLKQEGMLVVTCFVKLVFQHSFSIPLLKFNPNIWLLITIDHALCFVLCSIPLAVQHSGNGNMTDYTWKLNKKWGVKMEQSQIIICCIPPYSNFSI